MSARCFPASRCIKGQRPFTILISNLFCHEGSLGAAMRYRNAIKAASKRPWCKMHERVCNDVMETWEIPACRKVKWIRCVAFEQILSCLISACAVFQMLPIQSCVHATCQTGNGEDGTDAAGSLRWALFHFTNPCVTRARASLVLQQSIGATIKHFIVSMLIERSTIMDPDLNLNKMTNSKNPLNFNR